MFFSYFILYIQNAAFTFSTSKFYRTKFNHYYAFFISWTAINDNFTDRKDIKQRYVKPYHLICELLMLRSCLFESLCHPLECHNDLYYSFSWIDNSSFVRNILVWSPKMVLIKKSLVSWTAVTCYLALFLISQAQWFRKTFDIIRFDQIIPKIKQNTIKFTKPSAELTGRL